MSQILIINISLLWMGILVILYMELRIIRQLQLLWTLFQEQSRAPGPARGLQVGAPAPNFKAFTATGQLVTLDSYKGQNVIFVFVSPHCAPCHDAMPQLAEIYPSAKASGIELLLVTMTSPMEAKPLSDATGGEMPILYSPAQIGTLTDTYNPTHSYPMYCQIDKSGVVVSTNIIGGEDWSRVIQRWANP